MKKELTRFSVSVDWDLLEEFDNTIKQEGFDNRSLAIRCLLKEYVDSRAKNRSTSSKKQRGLFLIVFVSKKCANVCKCEVFLSFTLEKNGDKCLNLCIVNDFYSEIKKTFDDLESNCAVEYHKIIPITIEDPLNGKSC